MKGIDVSKGRAPAQFAESIADFEKSYASSADILDGLRKRAAIEAARGKPIVYQCGNQP